MLASIGLYWAAFGLPFAVGLVLSIYVHEMGHVMALQHYGIRASAPMFVPGLGAYIRLEQHPATVVEDARTGLAGPAAGLFAAVGCYAVYLAAASPMLAAIAKLGAWINLFNLFPVWQLDGGRAFASLSRPQRAVVAVAMLGCFLVTDEGLLLLLLMGAAFRLFERGASEPGDWPGVALFIALLVALSGLATIDVPGVLPS
jgi:Zn-dependent protease